MKAECCAGRRTQLASVGLASLPAVVLAALLPKCPLCIAAYLAAIGVSVALPEHSYAFAVLASATLGALGLILTRRRLI